MSKELGPVNLEPLNDGEFMFGNGMSDETAREIDMEVRNLIKREYDNTLNLLRENREKLDQVAELLLKKETITGAEVRAIITGKSVDEIEKEENATDTVTKLNEEENEIEKAAEEDAKGAATLSENI